MRRALKKSALFTGIVLLNAGFLFAADPPARAPAPGTGAPAAQNPPPLINPTVDQVLQGLDERGKTLNSFVAKLTLTETDEDTQLGSTRKGQVQLQRKPGDDARIHVTLDKKVTPKGDVNEKIEYLFDNGWLTDRDYQKKIEVRRQVVKPGQKVNLLKLGEGPFPLPIGQDPADVRKEFDVKLVKPAKTDPAATAHVQLTPLKGGQFARKFSSIDIWVDLKTRMPRQIDTLDANGAVSRSTKFDDLQVNPQGLADTDFKLREPGADWNVHEEPYAQ